MFELKAKNLDFSPALLQDKNPKIPNTSSDKENIPLNNNQNYTNKMGEISKKHTAEATESANKEFQYSLKEGYNWKVTTYKELDSPMLEILTASSVDRGNHDMTGPMNYYGSFTFGKDMVITVDKNSKISFSQVDSQATQSQNPLPSSDKTKRDKTDEKVLTVSGNWIKAGDLSDKDQPKGGNVFGKVGVYRLEDTTMQLQPPVLKADKVSKEFLNSFKASLVKNGEVIPWKSQDESICKTPVHFVTYQFGENYINNYVWKNGYFFIEKHGFPHYFTPVKEESEVNLTLGRNLTDRSVELATFRVPFGSTLLLEPNAIHTDSLSKGLVGLTLDEMAASDTVYLRNKANEKVRIVK